ncbi:hypothetical protein DMN91_012177 [Ooceraea biroi]|uniref:E3 ubiquitin-protein ligase Topors n=3 Tax=Ooceraea biroi TaxID=2015173 RepID=A0A026W8T2_OOCBI|nr:E3 ubiquitin-protein ligase Topors [Ooceraea biroi]RLU15183.1 hypothetical protein DMN91_012177 [Ooceraea biroi]
MEGSLEIKNSSAGVEEPIKSEAPAQNSDSSERSEGAASPPPNCSICLGKLINTSFTDSCLHQFCFTCLLQWSKIKTECPLCKQTFKSIIHNVRSEEDYDQYHVPRELASQISQPQVTATLDVNFDVGGNWDMAPRRFVYRTTMTGNRRHGVLLNPEQVARREQLPSITSQVSREERRRRRSNPLEYRRNIYRHGIWATALPDVFGRFRECSAEFYRRQPQELNRLIPWLNRELQVLLLNNEPSHVAYLLNIIIDALGQYDIRSLEFRNIVRPFFTIHTDHFAHELLNFAQTNFDLIGYDQSVTYMTRGLSNEYTARILSPASSSSTTSTSTTSSNSSITSDYSDVRILDEAMDLRVNVEMPPTAPRSASHPISMPGPSTVGQIFHRIDPYTPELLIISSTSSESEDGECEIIGYVKPRHERTPEIIELLSSDSEHVVVHDAPSSQMTLRGTSPENLTLPSTSQEVHARGSSLSFSTSDEDSSDNDYSSKQSKRNNPKKSSGKKAAAQKHKRSYATKSRNKRSKKRRSSSSDSSSSESSLKKYNERRLRKARYKVQTKGAGRIKLIKKEENYLDFSSSSNSSSSETDSKTKADKSRRQHRSRRKCTLGSSDRTAKSERTTRSKEMASALEKLRPKNKDQKYSESRQSRSRSVSESSNASDRDKRSSYSHRDARDTSDCGSRDDSASMNKDASRKERRSKSKKRGRYSSDSEDDRLRSSSQCSNHSNKSYSQWRKSKHKERKCKDKERHGSNSRALQSSENGALPVSASAKSDSYPTKHSDRSGSSGCKEKHRSSRRVYKESKHKKSENEKKSRPKKKKRRLQSSSTSNSE